MNDLGIRFAPLIAALPQKARFTRQDLLVPAFRLAEQGTLAIYYAPFDFVNVTARLALVGITPGWTQMEIAFRAAQRALLQGLPASHACAAAKQEASFAGAMSENLTAMLDGIGIARLLGLASSDSFFGERRDLLHTASVIRYPVFVAGDNYTGHSPKLLATPVLRRYVTDVLAPELASVGQALVIPLGKSAADAVGALIAAGQLDGRRCLLAFPHPSGANGHRVRQYTEQRAAMTRQAERWLAG